MSDPVDRYLQLSASPIGGWLLRRLGLPRPERLLRNGDAAATVTRPVLVGAAEGARLLPALAELFARERTASFYHRDPDGWRALADRHRLMTARFGAGSGRIGALLFDATGIRTVSGLGALYECVHDGIRAVGANGRIVVLSTPPDAVAAVGATVEAAAVQRGLQGFVRSLAKEARRAIAVQLVEVAPGAEAAIGGTLRFLLSPGSAYLSGQVVRIDAVADAAAAGGGPRRVLVTGAAQGIGAAIAALFAARGDHVVLLDVPASAATLADTAKRIGGTALALDITAADAPNAILAQAGAQAGAKAGVPAGTGFDVVVHNAGITRDRSIARMQHSDWDAVLAVNLLAPLGITETLLAKGGLNRNGRIVCVSSLSGIAGNAGQCNYALSKAGLIGMVQVLAPAARAAGVTINAVAPGFIETRMTAAIPFAIREAGRRLNSMGQGGRPVDIAEAICWLAARDSGGINGQTIRVCGQSLLGA